MGNALTRTSGQLGSNTADPAREGEQSVLAQTLERTAPQTGSQMVSKHPKGVLQPVVQDLQEWVYASQDRLTDFERAIFSATNQNVIELKDIRTLADWFLFVSSLLTWVPTETVDGTECFHHICVLYFVLSQPSVLPYQNALRPGSSLAQEGSLSFLSQWMIEFSKSSGAFLDTPDSLTPSTLSTFAACPLFHLSDYLPPRGGWRTFNEFFARRPKPGRRPIVNIGSNDTIVSPTDCVFCGQLPVSAESTVEAKGLTWSLGELLADSSFAAEGRFAGGIWMHAYLGVGDYHRVHAPVAGKVVDAKVVKGLHYTFIEAVDADPAPNASSKPSDYVVLNHDIPTEAGPGLKYLQKRRIFSMANEIGYQFQQTRGVVVLDTDIGLVAVIPVGMMNASSVILTSEIGATLHKGEEIGYFQFGGSDIVLVFENAARQVEIDATLGTHYNMGQRIGYARARDSH